MSAPEKQSSIYIVALRKRTDGKFYALAADPEQAKDGVVAGFTDKEEAKALLAAEAEKMGAEVRPCGESAVGFWGELFVVDLHDEHLVQPTLH